MAVVNVLLLQLELLLVLMGVVLGVQQQGQCTICRDGRLDVPLPNKTLTVKGIAMQTCGQLASTAAHFSASTQACEESFRRIGTLCGCPIQENACRVCSDEQERIANATMRLEKYELKDFLTGAPEGVFATCEGMEAILHDIDVDHPMCDIIGQDILQVCGGCQSNNGTTTNEMMNSTNTTVTTSPGDSIVPDGSVPVLAPISVSPCTLCKDGSSMAYPEKPLDLGKGLEVQACGDLNVLAASIMSNSFECQGLQSLGPMCGCPLSEPPVCTFCPNGEPVSKPEKTVNFVRAYELKVPDPFQDAHDSLTCEMIESTFTVLSPEVIDEGVSLGLACMSMQLKSHGCGCSPDWRQTTLNVVNRISGSLSVLGSLSIITDILRKREKRRTIYHQLVLSISLFDLISSIAYALSTTMTPIEGGLYHAKGNEMTCKLQGFMIQLGSTSMFYNLCLSLYFFLIIRFNWRDSHFEKLQVCIHVVVLSIGIVLACAGLPHYHEQYTVCYLLPEPAAESWLPVIFLYSVPVSLVLLVTTFTTVSICFFVYQQQKSSNRWSLRQNLKLSRRVFWQSFWYMLAFYATIPFVFLTFYWPFREARDIWVVLVGAFMAPSQGFLNALIFFQRAGGFGDMDVVGQLRRSLSRMSLRRMNLAAIMNSSEGADKGSSSEQNNHSNSRAQEASTAEHGERTDELNNES